MTEIERRSKHGKGAQELAADARHQDFDGTDFAQAGQPGLDRLICEKQAKS